jgi:hypothetical protein
MMSQFKDHEIFLQKRKRIMDPCTERSDLSETEKKHIIAGEEIIVAFDDFHKRIFLHDYFRDRTSPVSTTDALGPG